MDRNKITSSTSINCHRTLIASTADTPKTATSNSPAPRIFFLGIRFLFLPVITSTSIFINTRPILLEVRGGLVEVARHFVRLLYDRYDDEDELSFLSSLLLLSCSDRSFLDFCTFFFFVKEIKSSNSAGRASVLFSGALDDLSLCLSSCMEISTETPKLLGPRDRDRSYLEEENSQLNSHTPLPSRPPLFFFFFQMSLSPPWKQRERKKS